MAVHLSSNFIQSSKQSAVATSKINLRCFCLLSLMFYITRFSYMARDDVIIHPLCICFNAEVCGCKGRSVTYISYASSVDSQEEILVQMSIVCQGLQVNISPW
jgi:hypothetical protein